MRRRAGFTLVEMLVAMALILFIISILVSAFVAGLKSVADFKAAGDLAEKERAVLTLLRRDLAADHFEGKKRLSQPDFWADGPPREGFFRIYQGISDKPEGMAPLFADLDGIPSYYQVSTALHYTVKLRGNTRGDFFSADVPQGSPLLSAAGLGLQERRFEDSPNSYNAQWAEVAVFLAPATNAVGVLEFTDGAMPQPLFTLYRRQRLAVPDNSLVQPPIPYQSPQAFDAAGNNLYLETSTNLQLRDANGNLYFNSPRDLTMPVRRLGMDPANAAGVFNLFYGGANYPIMAQENVGYVFAQNGPLNTNYQSADLLVTDVLSFDVRVIVDEPIPQQNGQVVQGGTDFEDLYNLTDPNSPTRPLDPRDATGKTRVYYAFNNSYPNNARVFDTWSSVTQPDANFDYSGWAQPGNASSAPILNDTMGNKIRIKAIQITLRVWDFKTKKTRQVTMVQDL
jgi:prepilin-type N-terminal cleavage/methylation domain-containing protein